MSDESSSRRVFTIGHSDRTLEHFVRMLQQHDVQQIVDVRKLAGSRKYPHFNDDALAVSLPESGIGYTRIDELAGRRPVSKTVPFAVNAFWNNRSFHNYADYALSGVFRLGLDRLRLLSAQGTTAIMCSEAVWWRCHRRIITDHLLARGDDVVHIMSETKADAASLTSAAVTHPDGTVTYPPSER